MRPTDDIAIRVATLAQLDPRDEAAIERAELVIASFEHEPIARALHALLPCVVALAWPAPFFGAAAHRAGRARIARAATSTLRASLARSRPQDLVGIDASARALPQWWTWPRDGYWSRWRMLDVAGAERVVAEADDPWVSALLSTHPGGRVRERAVARLALQGADALPWLLLRTLDWVTVIRERAERAVVQSIEHATPETFDALIDALPLVTRLGNFTRADQRALMTDLFRVLDRGPERMLARSLGHGDRHVRRAGLERLDLGGHVDVASVARFLEDDDLGVRVHAARIAERLDRTARNGDELIALRRRLWSDRSGRVRAIGLALLADAESDEVLRDLLLRASEDATRAVRELAHQLAHARFPDWDLTAHHRRMVERASCPIGSVLALGETGRAEDWERLFPALDGSAAHACAAIASMRRLDRPASRETRLMMIHDPRPSVARAAARSLRGGVTAADERILAACSVAPLTHARALALELAIGLPGWAPARVVLAMSDLALRPRAESRLGVWLSRRFLHGATLGAAEAATLRAALAASPMVSETTRARFDRSLEIMTRA